MRRDWWWVKSFLSLCFSWVTSTLLTLRSLPLFLWYVAARANHTFFIFRVVKSRHSWLESWSLLRRVNCLVRRCLFDVGNTNVRVRVNCSWVLVHLVQRFGWIGSLLTFLRSRQEGCCTREMIGLTLEKVCNLSSQRRCLDQPYYQLCS